MVASVLLFSTSFIAAVAPLLTFTGKPVGVLKWVFKKVITGATSLVLAAEIVIDCGRENVLAFCVRETGSGISAILRLVSCEKPAITITTELKKAIIFFIEASF